MKRLLIALLLFTAPAAYSETFVCYARGINRLGFLSNLISGLGTTQEGAREQALTNCRNEFFANCVIITCERAD